MSKPASSTSTVTICDVLKTGKEVDSVFHSLVNHANDKDESVRSSLAFSLFDVGSRHPLLALSTITSYLQKNTKLDTNHKAILLRLMSQLLDEQTARDALTNAMKQETADQAHKLPQHIVKYVAKEMTTGQEPIPEICTPCNSILTLLSGVDCVLVVDELLALMPAGELPHYFIVKTLADIAANHPVTFVHKLKEVLARMTPVIGTIKKSPMMWVFATAFGRFSESMGHYTAAHLENAATNEGNAPVVNAAAFEIHMASAFDVMFTNWLVNAKEAKVKFACLESLGMMCTLLDKPALELRLPKLITRYLETYKKEKPADHLPISHGLCSSLKEGVKAASLVPLIQPLLLNLHPQVCRPVDFTAPSTAKNHNELLRIFEILARWDLDLILNFVIGRFQIKTEREPRLSSLIILRHFVNALDDILEDKKPLIMSSVLTLLNEQDLFTRKSILQLIVSMANQNYLLLEGGQSLVKFILQQSALPVDEQKEAQAPPHGTSPLQLRNAANHMLQVMATKVPSARSVLWPYLLELIIDPDFNRAALVIFRVLEHIASSKREEQAQDYFINFEAQVNMPPPQALMLRLITLAAEPFRRGPDSGIIVCRAMSALGPIIHPEIGKYWDESVPSLIAHLEEHDASTLQLSKWQDILLKMWRESIALIDAPKWLQDLALQLNEHFKLYKNDFSLLRCLHRYYGSLLSKIENRTILNNGIDFMLNQVNHQNDTERQGCAQGLGLCASVHLDVVLPKLTEKMASTKQEKKSGGFFSFGSSNKEKEGAHDHLLSTIMLCYGYVAAYANPELIVSRLDVHILHNLLPLIPKAKTNLLKIHLIKAMDLIGKALHASRLPEKHKNWKLNQRDEMITGLISFLDDKFLKAQQPPMKPSNEVRLLGVNAAATLANLEPPLPSALRAKLLEAVFPFYGLGSSPTAATSGNAPANQATSPSNGPQPSPSTSSSSSSSSDGTGEGKETEEEMIEMITTNLNTLLSTLVHMEPTVASLVDILKQLEAWMRSGKRIERQHAMTSYLVVLKKFVSKLIHDRVPPSLTAIPELGHYLAINMTRLNDSDLLVRQTAAENIQALLYINQILSNPDNPKPADEIKLITGIRNRLEEEVSDNRLVILKDICSLFTTLVNTNELITMLKEILLSGVIDQDQSSAQGSAVINKYLLSLKASEMSIAVKPLMTGLLLAIKIVRVGEVADAAFAAIRILTRIHFQAVVDQLLETSVPLATEVADAVMAIVETGSTEAEQTIVNRPVGMEPEYDAALSEKFIRHMIDVINETPIEKDKPTPIVMTATCFMKEIFEVDSIVSILNGMYADVLCTILMRIGTASSVDKGTSSLDASAALRAFLERIGEDVLLKKLDAEAVWPMLEGKNYDDGITIVTRCFSEVHSDRKRDLLTFLSKFYSQQSYTGQRIVATAMLAEFVNHSQNDDVLLRELIKFLLPRVADKVDKVRKQALRGLGHLVTVWNAETAAMATSVLSSLTAAAEDQDAEVAAEAVLSLTRIVAVVSEDLIGPMLNSICFRLRPAFDRKEERVRSRAFTLFGALNRFGQDGMEEGIRSNFLDQVHAYLPVFIIRSNDESKIVREAVINAFKELAPLLGEAFVPILNDATPEPYGYDELVTKVCPLLNGDYAKRLRSYLETISGYMTNPSATIKGNACFYMAVLITTAQPEARRTVSISATCQDMLRLLEDPTPSVRQRAAKALSLCYEL